MSDSAVKQQTVLLGRRKMFVCWAVWGLEVVLPLAE